MDESKVRTTDPTVFVVDDDDAMRHAVAALMDNAGIACRTYSSAQAFLDSVGNVERDVAGCLVLDVRMPGMDGLELQDALIRQGVDLPIVFVSRYGDVPTVVRAMKNGATDFLALPAQGRVLRDRIATALDEDVDRRERRRHLAELRRRTATLSPRETEVFERVATGQANKAVAIDLGISERTVEIHRSRVMRKMMANNLAELVRMKIFLDAGSNPIYP